MRAREFFKEDTDQMMKLPVGPDPKWNVIVQPGAGDRSANRKDVIISFLMFH